MKPLRGAFIAIAAAACTGCVNYNWQDNIERAEQRAKAENKKLFVFYKWWLDNDSNRAITDVLNAPEVARLFQGTVNCMIEKDYRPNQQYMTRHGVDRTPAFMIVAPDGTYQKVAGYVPKEAFIRWANNALSGKATDRPDRPPPVAPRLVP